MINFKNNYQRQLLYDTVNKTPSQDIYLLICTSLIGLKQRYLSYRKYLVWSRTFFNFFKSILGNRYQTKKVIIQPQSFELPLNNYLFLKNLLGWVGKLRISSRSA